MTGLEPATTGFSRALPLSYIRFSASLVLYTTSEPYHLSVQTGRASDKTRTRRLSFTKALLYQLSYTGRSIK